MRFFAFASFVSSFLVDFLRARFLLIFAYCYRLINYLLAMKTALFALAFLVSTNIHFAHAQTFSGKIGVNLGAFEFVDAMKSSVGWSPITGSTIALDSNGWPMADVRAGVFDVRPFGAWAPPTDDPQKVMTDVSGTYKLSFIGKATLSSYGDPFTIQNQLYDAANNRTTADLLFAKGGGLLLINFTNTNGGVRNVRLIRPGYSDTTTEIFRRELIDDLCPFSTMRFMDWEATNNDAPVVSDSDQYEHWANRKQTNDATQNSWGKKRDGIAWEYAIALANQAKKDMWVTIPVAADDDYVLQLAELMKASLAPGLRIYLEYSNEVWNSGFPQFRWNHARALEEVATGHSDLNYDGQTFDLYLASRRVARRIKEIGDIFRTVYGDAAFGTTIRPVFASQVAWAELARQGLSYLQHTFGDPSKYLYALAGAPYFGEGTPVKNESIPTIIDTMVASSDASRSLRTTYAGLAAQYGVKLVAYEGGPDTGGGDTTDIGNRILANRDTAMGSAVTHDLKDNWFPIGGDLFMYFGLNGNSSRYGCWGALEDITKPTTPKYLALKSLSGGCSIAAVSGGALPNARVLVFPNPARSVLHIRLPDGAEGLVKFSIFDILGRKVAGGVHVGRIFDISIRDLQAGVYTAEFISGSAQLRERIVIEHP